MRQAVSHRDPRTRGRGRKVLAAFAARKLLILLFMMASTAASGFAQDKALMKSEADKNHRVDVTIAAEAATDRPVTAAIYEVIKKKRRQIAKFQQTVTPHTNADGSKKDRVLQ